MVCDPHLTHLLTLYGWFLLTTKRHQLHSVNDLQNKLPQLSDARLF